MNKRFKRFAASLALFAAGLLTVPANAQKSPKATSAPNEEFFIISSIDQPKHRLVLKRPTEVTLTMEVSDQTTFRDEKGKPLRLSDFRAGDTVYALSKNTPEGLVALRIRKDAMTLEELHRRYLRFR